MTTTRVPGSASEPDKIAIDDALLAGLFTEFQSYGVTAIVRLRTTHPEQYLQAMAAVVRMQRRSAGLAGCH